MQIYISDKKEDNRSKWNYVGKNGFTSLIQDGQDMRLESLSLALAISEEPQRNLSPYIKVLDNSIMP